MVVEKFFLFTSLPLEIRRYIYLLATPPRIVHVEEETEDQDEFEEKIRTTPVQIKLDPNLAYFAFNWKDRIPQKAYPQLTLEDFGLTSKRPPGPWQPSKSTPEISLSFISNNLKYAWELIRRSRLYSKAPIPPLLHAFAESRAQLISHGYELAFKTRTMRPNTWFCFDRDILYLEVSSYTTDYHQPTFPDLLSGGPWDAGQFHPEDLQRVKRLALKGSRNSDSLYLFAQGGNEIEDRERNGTRKELSNLLRLMPGIAELNLVEWTEYDWPERSAGLRHSGDGWQCVQIEEIDALLTLLKESIDYSAECGLWSTGYNAEYLRAHKENDVENVTFFEHQKSRQQLCLAEEMHEIIQRDNDVLVSPWSIPKINVVHILPSCLCARLFKERQKAWKSLRKLKAQYKEIPSSVPASPVPPIDVANRVPGVRPQDLPATPFDSDEEEAYEDMVRNEELAYFDWSDHYEDMRKRQRTWFIEEGSVLEPKNVIL